MSRSQDGSVVASAGLASSGFLSSASPPLFYRYSNRQGFLLATVLLYHVCQACQDPKHRKSNTKNQNDQNNICPVIARGVLLPVIVSVAWQSRWGFFCPVIARSPSTEGRRGNLGWGVVSRCHLPTGDPLASTDHERSPV